MLKYNKCYFIIILLLVLCFSYEICYSNSPPLVMKGNTAYPINNNNIRLVSEKIIIRYNAYFEEFYNMHEVEVIFNFHNTGNKTVLEIGFPNTANYNEKLRDFEALSYPDLDPFDVELCEGGNLLGRDEYYYSSFYKWDMHFDKDEKKSILVRYKYINHLGADYILKTGSLWKGRVDKIDVYVEFPEPVSHLEIYATPENYFYNGKGIEWHFENINPDFDLYVEHIEIPDFYDFKSRLYPAFQNDFNHYKWNKALFFIGTMINLDNFEMMLYDYYDTDKIVEEIKARLSVCELVRNEIYARNGYVFKEPKWVELFSMQPWYEPDDNFNFNKLNDIEKINIEQIIRFEKTIDYTDDMTSEQLINNLIDYTNKYDDKRSIFYTDYNSYKYTNKTYNKIISENERIKSNRSNFQDLIILPDNFVEFFKDDKKHIKITPMTPETLEFQDIYVFGENIINISTDEKTRLLKSKEDFLYLLTELDKMKVKSISPNGKYVIIAGKSIPGFIEEDIYLISMDDGTGYLLCKGDFENYQFEWSINDSLLFRHKKDNKNIIKHFNSKTGLFKTRVIPINDFERFHVSDKGAVVIQAGNIIYYMGDKDDSFKKIVDDGNLIGFSSDCNVLFFEGLNIKEFDTNKSIIRKLSKVAYPIWKTECVYNNYIIYCGIDIIYYFNQESNILYKYYDLKNVTDLKFSPEGDKLLVHIESIFDYDHSSTYIIYGNSNEKRPLKITSHKSVWLDNNNIVTYSVDLDEDEIIRTITNISDEVNLFYDSDSKSIGKSNNSAFIRPINYFGFSMLIILCIIYIIYKKKTR